MTRLTSAAAWNTEFDLVAARLAPRFRGKVLRLRAEGYLRGPLDRVQRKDAWQLTEAVGHVSPHGISVPPGAASWGRARLDRSSRAV